MLTKLDMAKVCVQALYNLNALPGEDNIHVQRMMKAKKPVLETRYRTAHKILTDKVSAGNA